MKPRKRSCCAVRTQHCTGSWCSRFCQGDLQAPASWRPPPTHRVGLVLALVLGLALGPAQRICPTQSLQVGVGWVTTAKATTLAPK